MIWQGSIYHRASVRAVSTLGSCAQGMHVFRAAFALWNVGRWI
jgi:hypothetical protein